MKAALAGMIYAVYLLKELDVPLSGRIGLCIVADEETGGQGGSHYLEEIGLPRGPLYRELLQRLQDERLNGKIVTVADEKALIQRLIAEKGFATG